MGIHHTWWIPNHIELPEEKIYIPGAPKENATCFTDCNFPFSAPKLLSDGSFLR